MALKISRKDWDDENYKSAILGVAEVLHEDIEIVYPRRVKLYNVQIWASDKILLERDFMKRSQAMKWIKKTLAMRKCRDAYADLKKYNKNNDDFDWWFYKLENNKVVETLNI